VIKEQLRSLGLRHTAEILDDVVAVATKNRWGAQQVFEHVARIEAEERARRSLERRLGRSKLGKFKPFADFDWLLDLGAQESARALDQRLRHYCTRTGLLVIDEIGYLSYDNRNADLLFCRHRSPVSPFPPASPVPGPGCRRSGSGGGGRVA
jgi:DNA replication protein DnaC